VPAVAAPASASSRYVFEGRTVAMPVVVRDASSASATFLVPSEAARALIGGHDLDVAEVAPGRTLFSLAAIDYRDNDLGDYNEVSFAFFVHPRVPGARGSRIANAAAFLRGTLPTYIHRLPVDQSFTCAAGRGIWGFPKTVERIDMEVGASRCRTTLAVGGREVFRWDAPRGGRMRLPEKTMLTYSRIDGVLHATRFVSGAQGLGVRLGGSTLELADHPLADELRSLGLPKRALMSAWMEHMHGRFEAPVRV
jgi:hypothetical protein